MYALCGRIIHHLQLCVMPGLFTLSDGAFVEAFQGLETRFQNPDNFPGYRSVGYGNIPALIAFPGSILFSLIAIFLNWKTNNAKLIFAALVIFILGMITTILYNLPSNEVIYAAGEVSASDAAQVRKEFNEVAWLKWNHFRMITTLIGTIFLAKSLYNRLQ